jgi:tetratricopeptide (TPR) repeat protein
VLAELRIPKDNVKLLTLASLDERRIAALMQAAGGNVRSLSADAAAVAVIADVSDGDPFYVRYLIEDLNTTTAHSLEELKRRPPGLEAYLREWYEDLSRGLGPNPEPMQTVDMLLGLLVASKGRLLRQELAGLTKLNDLWLGKALQAVSRFVVGDEDSGYALCHARFQEFLAAKLGTTVPRGRSRMIEWCLEQHSSAALSGGSSATPTYALRHLAQHLNDDGSVDQLVGLIDWHWMRQHLARFENYEYLLADLEIAARAAWHEQPSRADFLARLNTVRQLTRWNVDQYADHDLATLTILGSEQRAIKLARSRDTPLAKVQALITIWHADETSRPSILEEIEMLARSSEDKELKLFAAGAVAFAVAKSGNIDDALKRSRKIEQPEYRWQALQLIGELLIGNGRVDLGAKVLDEAVEVADADERALQWADRLIETANVQVAASLDATKTVKLAIECASSASSAPIKRARRVVGITRNLARMNRLEEAISMLEGLAKGVKDESALDRARIQVRMARSYAGLEQEGAARRLLSEVVDAVRASRHAYNFQFGAAAVTSDCIELNYPETAEELLSLIDDTYHRSKILYNFVVFHQQREDLTRAKDALRRMDDAEWRTRAASYLAWYAAKHGDLSRARQMFSEMTAGMSYTVRNVSVDATANWMRRALVSLASLLAANRDWLRCGKIIEFADRLPASHVSGRGQSWANITINFAMHGDVKQAKHWYKRVQEYFDENASLAAEIPVAMARALATSGHTEQAVELADDLLNGKEGELNWLMAFLAISRALREKGAISEARGHLENARRLAQAMRKDAELGGAAARYQRIVSALCEGLLEEEIESGSGQSAIEGVFSMVQNNLEQLFVMQQVADAGHPDKALALLDNIKGIHEGQINVALEDDIARSFVSIDDAKGAEAIARRLFRNGCLLAGARTTAHAAACWSRLGTPERGNGLIDDVRPMVDNDSLGPYAAALAEAGRADESLSLALGLPNATIDLLGTVGTDRKLDVLTALVRNGSLAHGAQLLAPRIAAPDAPDVWLANLGECLESASGARVPEALGMFIEAATVVSWVRPDWREALAVLSSGEDSAGPQ